MNDECEWNMDDSIVNIHGHKIPTLKVQNREVCLLTDLKQTGACIYRKSQYDKLSKLEKDYDHDFIEHMLEAAKTYMLTNKISFSHEEIMNSIENSKQILSGVKKSEKQGKKSSFFKERTFEAFSEEEIRIRLTSTPKETQASSSSKQETPPTKKSYPRKEKRTPKRKVDSGVGRSESSVESESQEHEDVPTLRLPKKKIVYNVTQNESDVFVTHIDKPNCCWVREKQNEAQMTEIHRKVNLEAKYQKAVPHGDRDMDTMYMAEDEGNWYRCKIVRFTPLTVLFVDYGNFAEVNEVREISEELADLPYLAIRITFKGSEYTPCLEDEIRIKRFMKNQDGTFFVNIVKVYSSSAPNVSEITQKLQVSRIEDQKIQNRKEEAFFKKPPSLCSLIDNQKVAIAYEKNGVFYLRNSECFAALRRIEKEIDEYVAEAGKMRKICKDQLVLYHCNKNAKWYRAVVRKVDEFRAEIELLDYVEMLMVDLKSLRTISKKLSEEPVTHFVGGKLVGFEDKDFGGSCRKLIEGYIRTKKEFVVRLGFDAELDLFDGTRLLSEQLPHLDTLPQKLVTFKSGKPQKKIYLKDIKTLKPRVGVESYIIGSYKSQNELSLVPTDELQKNIDYILRAEIEDEEVYISTVGEVCLCFYIDNWYRCVVTRVFDKEYEILLLDFGNIELIQKNYVRKADDKITEIPALALPSVLINVPPHQNIENILRKMIVVGNAYNVDVKKISNGKCHVEIPLVYEEIKL